MPTSPHRASARAARSPLAAAATQTVDPDHEAPANEPLAPKVVPLAATEPSAASAEELTFDNVLNDWFEHLGREPLSYCITLGDSMMRSAEKLAAVQVEMSQQVQQNFEAAGQRLQGCQGLADLPAIQASLLQADLEAMARHTLRLAELSTEAMTQLWQDGSTGQARVSGALWTAAMNWMRLQSTLPSHADMLEAEVDHVLSPLTASPLVWPAQEATRQAALLAANGWNGWLDWSGQWAEAGCQLFNNAGKTAH